MSAYQLSRDVAEDRRRATITYGDPEEHVDAQLTCTVRWTPVASGGDAIHCIVDTIRIAPSRFILDDEDVTDRTVAFFRDVIGALLGELPSPARITFSYPGLAPTPKSGECREIGLIRSAVPTMWEIIP